METPRKEENVTDSPRFNLSVQNLGSSFTMRDLSPSLMSNRSNTKPRSRQMHIEPKHDITRAKEMALLKISQANLASTGSFTRFYRTETMDEFLTSIANYFHALFRYHKAHQEREQNILQHDDNDTEDALTTSMNDAARSLKRLGIIYARVILTYSNHEKPLVEKRFFELLYEFVQHVLTILYDRRYWAAIRKEIGRIFRSDEFAKINARPTEPVAPLVPLRKLYSAGSKTPIRDGWTERCAIHRAINARSPLICILFPTAKDLAALEIIHVDIFRPPPAQPSAAIPHESSSTSLILDTREVEETISASLHMSATNIATPGPLPPTPSTHRGSRANLPPIVPAAVSAPSTPKESTRRESRGGRGVSFQGASRPLVGVKTNTFM